MACGEGSFLKACKVSRVLAAMSLKRVVLNLFSGGRAGTARDQA